MTEPEKSYFDLSKSKFVSALWLDNIFPKKIRRGVAKVLDFLIFCAFAAIILSVAAGFIPFENLYFSASSSLKETAIDFLFLVLSFRLVFFALESFYRSKASIKEKTSFEAASLLAKTLFKCKALSGADILRTFLETEIGKFSLFHLGISIKDFHKIIESVGFGTIQIAQVETKGIINISDIFTAILENDESIAKLFFDLKIKKEDIEGVLGWAENYFSKIERASAWWQEENLARIQGLAKDWAYAATYLLDQYSRVFKDNHPVGRHQVLHFTGHQKQITKIETILSRKAQANVLVVGEPGTGKRSAIAGLDHLILTGKARPELEYKRVLELNAPAIVANAKTKGEMENLLIRLFNDAVKAGNIILVIDNFPEFLNSAGSLGISILQVLGPYLGNSNLQVIAVSDAGGYKRFIEPDSSLSQYFEVVKIEEPDKAELIQILEDIAMDFEIKNKIIIPYQTITTIINVSNNYLTEGALPERAIDIVETVISRVSGLPAQAGERRGIVLPEDVSALVSEKTKMPIGALKPEEKEKLANIESVLHRRIVNQEEAISAISSAVRRVRTGLQETKKPLASFLFLGPTGVGKTETAKALSEIYFGNEEAMTRFDMSEYQNENGLERLIGSFERKEQGILAAKLREKPYGLLLLDEFEKCHAKIRDLFLQVFDEGFFTDAFGRKVMVRNNIIIATSNAASQLIWEIGKKGALPVGEQPGVEAAALKDSVIDFIQKEGIFKAELLNRFDGIIIFRHLSKEHLKMIAKIMLEKLKKRLFEKNEIELIINDVLLEKVAEIGYDPVFGARPMQRAIQERVEKKIAEWIIGGRIERGAKIEFILQDLEGI